MMICRQITLVLLLLFISPAASQAQVIYKYDEASGFSEGLAAVSLGGKYGFINQSGEIAIPLEYDDAGNFSEGLARVKKNDKWGFIDKSGKVVISFLYQRASDFREGLAKVREGENWKFGFINKKGIDVVPLEYEYIWSDFYEGLVAAERYDDDKVGIIDQKGRVVLPFEYDYIEDFENGYAYVVKNEKESIVNNEGEIVIPVQHESIYPYLYNGEILFVITDTEKQEVTVLDKKGERILHLTGYSDGYFFRNGLLSFADNQGNYGAVNLQGETIIPFRYQQVVWDTEIDGLVHVLNDNKWGLYKLSGVTLETIVSPKYDKTNYFSEGLAVVKSGDKWGYIDTDGKEVIPLKFDGSGERDSEGEFNGGDFSEGFAPVCRFGKYGYVDKQGKLLPLKD